MFETCLGKVIRHLFVASVMLASLAPRFARAADGLALQSGDVIFHTSHSAQSYAIMWASKSLYSHVGVIEVDGKKTYVVEAISKVSRTPLEKWKARGRFGRFAIFRYEGLNDDQRAKIVSGAKALMGRPYDIFFTSKNDSIYCSELVEKAFESAGLKVGTQQTVKELDVDNALVRRLVKSRWKGHPVCAGAKTFDECWTRILDDTLVTPDSIASDSHFKKISSNYP